MLAIVPGCTTVPAPTRVNDAGLPTSFEGPAPEAPEIASSLKTLFSAPELNRQIDRALRRNPDLRTAALRLEEAGFNTRRSKATLLPSLTANTSRSRSNTDFQEEVFTGTLDARWEVDLWGRLRAGVNAASLNETALSYDLRSAHQSIAAQTAQAWFNLVSETQLLRLTERSLKNFENTLSLVETRFEAGLVNLGDLDLARTDVETTRAQLAARRDERDKAARQLAALTGDYPSANRSAAHFPSLARSVRPGAPSTLLMKRPDIVAAYHRIRAADANVTVAHRDLYPSFTLTASTGQRSPTLRQLANSNFNTWSILANLSAPLLDGGSRRAELGSANSRAKQALSQYQATVLTALREVEDALGSDRYLASQEASTRLALKAARSAESRIQRNYESGLLEILSLLETQRRAFLTEEALINVRTLRFQNRVRLALASGRAL